MYQTNQLTQFRSLIKITKSQRSIPNPRWHFHFGTSIHSRSHNRLTCQSSFHVASKHGTRLAYLVPAPSHSTGQRASDNSHSPTAKIWHKFMAHKPSHIQKLAGEAGDYAGLRLSTTCFFVIALPLAQAGPTLTVRNLRRLVDFLFVSCAFRSAINTKL